MTAIIAINNAIRKVTNIPEGLIFEERMRIPITQSIHSVQLISRLVNTMSDLSTLYYGKLPKFPLFIKDWLKELKTLEQTLLKAEARCIGEARTKYHDFIFENLKNMIPVKLRPKCVKRHSCALKS